jgi:hypothetical protein
VDIRRAIHYKNININRKGAKEANPFYIQTISKKEEEP